MHPSGRKFFSGDIHQKSGAVPAYDRDVFVVRCKEGLRDTQSAHPGKVDGVVIWLMCCGIDLDAPDTIVDSAHVIKSKFRRMINEPAETAIAQINFLGPQVARGGIHCFEHKIALRTGITVLENSQY